MKKILLSLIVVLAIFFSISLPVLAAPEEAVPIAERVPYLWYGDEPPIPVGEKVTLNEGGDRLFWEQRLGNGYRNRLFWFPNIELKWKEVCPKYVISSYEDKNGDNFVDTINLEPYTRLAEVGVQRLSAIFVNQLPVPIGEVVKFTKFEGELGIEWIERTGNTYTVHKYIFDPSISLQFSDLLPPKIGRAVVNKYVDELSWNYNVKAETVFRPDGVVDKISFVEYLKWDERETRIIMVGKEFYKDLVKQNLAIIYYASDYPVRLLIDGQPAKAGPYGHSYFVRPEGSRIEAVSENYYRNWTQVVKPGQRVAGSKVSSYNTVDPLEFYEELKWMRPQWQSYDCGTPSFEYNNPAVNCRSNTSLIPSLNRLGFYESSLGQESHPKGWTIYTASPERVDFDKELPIHTWVNATQVEITSTEVYSVTLGKGEDYRTKKVAYYPRIVYLPTGKEVSVAWWENLILFAPEKAYELRDCLVYRVVRTGWEQFQLQKLVWTE